jgi:N-acetylglutamate synthase/N-acetylornithine aminotransferase
MHTHTNVAEDLAALRAIATENNISPREVLWLAITRTIKSNSTRASVSRFFYACKRTDRTTTPEFVQFKAELQAVCKALGVKMVRDGRTWFVLKPAGPQRAA